MGGWVGGVVLFYGLVLFNFLTERLVSDIVASTMFLRLIRIYLLVSFRTSKMF